MAHRWRSWHALAVLACLAGPAPAQLPWPDSAARVRGWREDLDTAVTVFLPRDRSFDPEGRLRFSATLRTLRDSVPALTDEQLIVRLGRRRCVSLATGSFRSWSAILPDGW